MTEIAFAEDHASKEGAECEGHAEQGGRAESDTERGRENRQSEQFARARSGDTFQYPGRGARSDDQDKRKEQRNLSERDKQDERDIARAARSSFRSEEHTSELQSLMRISYAVSCLKKKKK